MSSGPREQFERSIRQFVQNELDTGITFAHLALDSRTEETRQRTQQNARKAYDTAKHFMDRHLVGEPTVQLNLLAHLTALRDLLLQLGETLEE